MERLYDKLAVVLICITGFIIWGGDIAPVVGILGMLTITSLVELTRGSVCASVIICISCLFCGVAPIFICAIPVFLYDALWEKRPWLIISSLTIFIHIYDVDNAKVYAIPVIGCLVVIIMYFRIYRLENMVEALKVHRDDAMKSKLRLESRNKLLIKKQDDEAYLATLRERNRIAREIHDNVGHMLTRALLQVGALSVVNEDEKLFEPIEALNSSLNDAMTSIRKSVHDLHDVSVDLKKAIEESIKTLDKRFIAELEYDVDAEVSAGVKLCVLGVVKESLSNAVRHSTGSHIDIVFREHPKFYKLVIADDGRPDPITQTGIGLTNMRERASAVGGRIEFEATDTGFKVFLLIPKDGGSHEGSDS